jgi:hypothetical protein
MNVSWNTLSEKNIEIDVLKYEKYFKENENTVFKLKDFNYLNKSKKYRLLKKYAKQKGFKYIKRMYLPTKVLMFESTKDIKSQIDMIGE